MPPAPAAIAGSSPHTRGTRHLPLLAQGPGRLIPAHAGNTEAIDPPNAYCSAHPRTRGEHLWIMAPAQQEHGSSPHTRGTRRGTLMTQIIVRLIPAHAGNTACLAA